MVSVIIPTYNRAGLVVQAIDSVLAQTCQEFEIIVVDDGSTDNTREVVAAYGDKVRYVYQDNAGVYAARNHGIRLSKGSFIAFLDSDDVWEKDKLACQLNLLIKYPEYAAVHTASSTVDKDGRIIESVVNPQRQSHDGKVFDEFFEFNMAVILLSTVMICRECFDKIGLFDEHSPVATDHFFFLRLAFYYQIAFIDEPLVRYRLTDGSLSRRNVLENVTWREKLLREFIDEFDEYFSVRGDLVKKKWRSFYYDAGMKLFYAKDYEHAREYLVKVLFGNKKAWLYYLRTLIKR